MNNTSSKLFNRDGYIPIKEYVNDIQCMKNNGTWKLPLRIIDYLHFSFLVIVVKFSWFAEALYIINPSKVGPAFTVLLAFLKKKSIFDSYVEGNLHFRGYFSYYLEKKVKINNHVRIMSGQGVSEDKAIALSKALGEMIERAVSGMYDLNKKIKIISLNDLTKKFPVIYPPKYHRFLNIQKNKFAELHYDPAKAIAWVEGKNLITNIKTYIPRTMTSWFTEESDLEEVFINATTNGAAGYFTKDGAALRGLLEVVQRDAFLVHWLTTFPPQIVAQETLPKDLQEKVKEFELFGISIYILNVTSIPIPSIFIAAINKEAETPQVVLTGASALTFEEAIHNSLREMVLGLEMFYYVGTKAQLKYKDIEPEPFIADIGKITRQLYWRGNKRVKQFEWFLSGDKVSYNSLCEQDLISEKTDSCQLEVCLEVLKKLGSSYYPTVYYPKNKIQDELGFYVAQIFIPKAFPLYLSEYYGTFDSDRLEEFAVSKENFNWKLNPLPHMFP